MGQKEREWLSEIEQEAWKKEKFAEWEKKGIKEQLEKIKGLMMYLGAGDLHSKKALYAFYLIQELRGQPTVKSIGPKEIEWISKTRKEIAPIKLVEENKELALPTIAQTELT